MRPKIKFYLPALFKHDDKTNIWQADCPVLLIVSQGETKAEAHEALTSAVRLFLHNCHKRRILESTLAEYGFEMSFDEEERSSKPPCAPRSFEISIEDEGAD